MAKPRPAPAKKASDPMTLMNLTAGKWVSQAIAVAAELGIADLLKDGPRTAADIARTANASEDGVYRLLRALGSFPSAFIGHKARKPSLFVSLFVDMLSDNT